MEFPETSRSRGDRRPYVTNHPKSVRRMQIQTKITSVSPIHSGKWPMKRYKMHARITVIHYLHTYKHYIITLILYDATFQVHRLHHLGLCGLRHCRPKHPRDPVQRNLPHVRRLSMYQSFGGLLLQRSLQLPELRLHLSPTHVIPQLTCSFATDLHIEHPEVHHVLVAMLALWLASLIRALGKL